ncbi:MAG: hypothetical protein H6850_02200 [Alphaproteobacteria bacterium]|nr:MAG: hypothetical protein H6850_02200 [Alphaproteobacteria bacterium]
MILCLLNATTDADPATDPATPKYIEAKNESLRETLNAAAENFYILFPKRGRTSLIFPQFISDMLAHEKFIEDVGLRMFVDELSNPTIKVEKFLSTLKILQEHFKVNIKRVEHLDQMIIMIEAGQISHF